MSGRSRKTVIKRELIFWGILFLAVIVDIAAKHLAFSGYFDGCSVLSHEVRNKGITFGLLQGVKYPVIIVGVLIVARQPTGKDN